jgi:hypothetical protein
LEIVVGGPTEEERKRSNEVLLDLFSAISLSICLQVYYASSRSVHRVDSKISDDQGCVVKSKAARRKQGCWKSWTPNQSMGNDEGRKVEWHHAWTVSTRCALLPRAYSLLCSGPEWPEVGHRDTVKSLLQEQQMASLEQESKVEIWTLFP